MEAAIAITTQITTMKMTMQVDMRIAAAMIALTQMKTNIARTTNTAIAVVKLTTVTSAVTKVLGKMKTVAMAPMSSVVTKTWMFLHNTRTRIIYAEMTTERDINGLIIQSLMYKWTFSQRECVCSLSTLHIETIMIRIHILK